MLQLLQYEKKKKANTSCFNQREKAESDDSDCGFCRRAYLVAAPNSKSIEITWLGKRAGDFEPFGQSCLYLLRLCMREPSFSFSFYCCTCSIWKFPGQGSNQNYSSRPMPQPQQCQI